jgi:hypothetical protein
MTWCPSKRQDLTEVLLGRRVVRASDAAGTVEVDYSDL